MQRSARLDRFVREQSLALFLCAPDALHAVNRHVALCPYRTTSELAETEVGERHWSRRGTEDTAPPRARSCDRSRR